MPVSPWMAEDLSAGVRDLYSNAEERLLSMVARHLADDIDGLALIEGERRHLPRARASRKCTPKSHKQANPAYPHAGTSQSDAVPGGCCPPRQPPAVSAGPSSQRGTEMPGTLMFLGASREP
jgi:hypothetical protein